MRANPTEKGVPLSSQEREGALILGGMDLLDTKNHYVFGNKNTFFGDSR
jgi:hypothetical protein